MPQLPCQTHRCQRHCLAAPASKFRCCELRTTLACTWSALYQKRFSRLLPAAAPFHKTAVGVYTRLKRQPQQPKGDHTAENTALLYGAYRLLTWQLPEFNSSWRGMMTSVRPTHMFATVARCAAATFVRQTCSPVISGACIDICSGQNMLMWTHAGSMPGACDATTARQLTQEPLAGGAGS